MKKVFDVLAKVLLSLILLMPIVGAFGVFPEPTADMYTSKEAFDFIQALMNAKYIPMINAFVFALSLVLLWSNRVALAALLILPITVNIVAFHAFLDGGLLTGGAVLGNVMLALNLYFLWQKRETYKCLLAKK